MHTAGRTACNPTTAYEKKRRFAFAGRLFCILLFLFLSSVRCSGKHLSSDPLHEDRDDIGLLVFRKFPSLRDAVPLLEAGSAAAGGGVLCRNTGWPRIGVCFPSFAGSFGASRFATKSSAWDLMVSMPFSRTQALSLSERENPARNPEQDRRSNRRFILGLSENIFRTGSRTASSEFSPAFFAWVILLPSLMW